MLDCNADEMIHQHKYAYYYWINCQGFNQSEFQKIVKAISDVVPIIDGVDEEDHAFCLTFGMNKPQTVEQLNYCRKINEIKARRFLKDFQKSLGGRLYFNIKRHELKWIR